MIRDIGLVTENISEWIANYCKNNNIESIIIPWENTHQAVVNTYLCNLSRKHYNTGVFICTQSTTSFFKDAGFIYINPAENLYLESLKIASKTRSLVAGHVDMTYGKYARAYSKHKEGLADIFPLYSLYFSEVLEIFSSIFDNAEGLEEYKKIQGSKEYSYRDIEWASQHKILKESSPPNTNQLWWSFTLEQKIILSYLHSRILKTNHKSLESKPHPTRESTLFT